MTDRSDSYVCSPCRDAIILKNEFACAFCWAPVVLGKTCPFCRRDGRYLDRLLVAAGYEQPLVEDILKKLKYKFVRSLTDEAAAVMIKYLGKNDLFKYLNIETCLVLPVPLHPKRLNWRGFNQSEIIAEIIAAHFGWPLNIEILKRAKHHPPQADIKDRSSRIKNMSGVFACVRPEVVIGRTVLLVDDVSTTGSTLNDCARCLKAEGAGEVIGLVFARNR